MFDRFSDQAGDRNISFWVGTSELILSAVCFYEGVPVVGCMFATMGFCFMLPPILCGHASFETVRRIWLWIIAFGG